ncbi:multidrug DMT transporter permease [Burkholderia ubonensis]|uniref:type III secretion system effector BopA family protein n=1 Tax=Burkholderia ubonensis TaxID=101571 RepID=UPI00075C6E68|nr:type III secretion system effector BopA family protein [Burkholderia ubonensis]KWC24946.1 multidrug DMT transporter permease [Burkholderia ubonensis]KWC49706.1 multidrug DMT transporter permease [Burkholderia ubonensis]
MINVGAFVACARTGHRVVVDDGEKGLTAAVARLGVKERVLEFLTHVPLLKQFDAVRRYAEQVRVENGRTLEVFVLALSKRYGEQAAQAAFEHGARRDGVALERRLVNSMVSIAEHFHGSGAAKPLTRHIVFRSWESHGFSHPGHASITIKNQAAADVARHVYEHVSWWPTRPVSDRPFSPVASLTLSSYRSDKQSELSPKTKQKLQDGAAAREKIRADGYRYASAEEIADARFFPRAAQKPDGSREWGLSARKVYLPAIGRNPDRTGGAGDARFVLFGLDEAAILRDARAVKQGSADGTLSYRMASTKENCAAVALRVLRAGGAERFVPFTAAWIAENPNRAHAYAQAVQTRIDVLNQHRADIARYCAALCDNPSVRDAWQAFSAGASNPARAAGPDDCARQVERLGAYFTRLSGPRLDRGDADLANAMRRCAPAVGDDVAALTRKASVFVETLARHFDVPPKDDQAALRRLTAHAMVEQIEAFMSIAIAA